MTEPNLKPAALLAPVAIALVMAAVVTGLGHVILHLRPQTDMVLGAVIFAASSIVLLAVRGLKMDTSYTL